MSAPRTWAALRLALLLALAGCGGGGEPAAPGAPDPTVEEARRRADAAIGKLQETLSGELQKALREGPPEGAIGVCAEKAHALTEAVAKDAGLSIRRTALRARNPKNAPDDYERAVLEAWSKPGAAREPRAEVVAGKDGRELRVVKPIFLQPLCAQCHGAPDEIAPAVMAAVAARYPGDRATGFKPGDLRGAVSVRVALAVGAAVGR